MVIRTERTMTGYQVRFAYDKQLISLIKTLPSGHYHWVSDIKAWYIGGLVAAEFFTMARAMGHLVIGYDDPLVAPETKDVNAAAAFQQVFDLVGPEREEQVFRALVKALHPDRENGSTELTQALNTARRQVTR